MRRPTEQPRPELLTELLSLGLSGAGLAGRTVAVALADLRAANAGEADVSLPARVLARADDVRRGRVRHEIDGSSSVLVRCSSPTGESEQHHREHSRTTQK